MSSVLARPGDADDQAVAADEQRLQHQLHDLVLADDPLVQLGDDRLAAVVHLVGERDVVGDCRSRLFGTLGLLSGYRDQMLDVMQRRRDECGSHGCLPSLRVCITRLVMAAVSASAHR